MAAVQRVPQRSSTIGCITAQRPRRVISRAAGARRTLSCECNHRVRTRGHIGACRLADMPWIRAIVPFAFALLNARHSLLSVRAALRWTAKGQPLPGQGSVNRGVRGHLSWVSPASAASGPELRVRPAAASSWPGEVPPGASAARSSGIGRWRQGEFGTGGQSPGCPARRPAGPDPADQGCGRPHSGVPARGRVFSRLPARARWAGDPARPGRPGAGGAYVNEQARLPRAVGVVVGRDNGTGQVSTPF